MFKASIIEKLKKIRTGDKVTLKEYRSTSNGLKISDCTILVGINYKEELGHALTLIKNLNPKDVYDANKSEVNAPLVDFVKVQDDLVKALTKTLNSPKPQPNVQFAPFGLIDAFTFNEKTKSLLLNGKLLNEVVNVEQINKLRKKRLDTLIKNCFRKGTILGEGENSYVTLKISPDKFDSVETDSVTIAKDEF